MLTLLSHGELNEDGWWCTRMRLRRLKVKADAQRLYRMWATTKGSRNLHLLLTSDPAPFLPSFSAISLKCFSSFGSS